MLTHHKFKTFQWIRKRNKQRKRLLLFTSLLLALLCISLYAGAQDKTNNPQLSEEQVLQIVKQFHPVSKQAELVIEKARAGLTISRGQFDPVLDHEQSQKTFDGTTYYRYNRSGLNIPAWFGIELRAGLENLSGNRTDPTETKGETSYLGILVPLGKNLLMDKRRAALQRARIYRDASPVEKRSMLNHLLLEAIKSYWNWVRHYQVFTILREAVIVNEKRVQLVKKAFLLGDRPAIDTAEALTQLQFFEVQKSQAWAEFQNAGLDLSVYLWTENNEPYYLPESVVPAVNLQPLNSNNLSLPDLNLLLEQARKNNPDLLLYNYKLDVLELEKKLKFQELLPTLNFNYQQLGKGYDLVKTATAPLLENNYRYGIGIGIPLRLSEGRGEYRKAKLMITEVKLEQGLKQLQLENKVKAYFNELSALKTQLSIQEAAYRNYATLQRGEETRFSAGESSLFLVNARENKTLEALQKLQELKAKFFQTRGSLQWAAGLLDLI